MKHSYTVLILGISLALAATIAFYLRDGDEQLHNSKGKVSENLHRTSSNSPVVEGPDIIGTTETYLETSSAPTALGPFNYESDARASAVRIVELRRQYDKLDLTKPLPAEDAFTVYMLSNACRGVKEDYGEFYLEALDQLPYDLDLADQTHAACADVERSQKKRVALLNKVLSMWPSKLVKSAIVEEFLIAPDGSDLAAGLAGDAENFVSEFRRSEEDLGIAGLHYTALLSQKAKKQVEQIGAIMALYQRVEELGLELSGYPTLVNFEKALYTDIPHEQYQQALFERDRFLSELAEQPASLE